MPAFVRARAGAHARTCISNLKQILSAKERWAMENDRGPTDTPLMTDLAGAGKYIKLTPLCPGGGNYTVNQLGTLPVCDVGGTHGDFDAHILP
jgi:hypothetical protein